MPLITTILQRDIWAGLREVGNTFSLDPDLWREEEKVTELDNNNLPKPFTEQEIKNALDQMEENKAIGPDSISIEFYQHT
jgi:hypothetical protein